MVTCVVTTGPPISLYEPRPPRESGAFARGGDLQEPVRDSLWFRLRFIRQHGGSPDYVLGCSAVTTETTVARQQQARIGVRKQ
ncbi:hypothetical protein EYF80_030274 [Liparis tanakae]|uniref:Uncharacterized protein n=1 Tax=Liparis tanakae TaxID=230148 RepID=A0A4Z2H119_9TELE|nr:hypothetical protein EYF80_030274 [Liparis tanakae]